MQNGTSERINEYVSFLWFQDHFSEITLVFFRWLINMFEIVHHNRSVNVIQLWSIALIIILLAVIRVVFCQPMHKLVCRTGIIYHDFVSLPQIEYPLGDSSKICSHAYFLLQVLWVILVFCQIVLLFDINVLTLLPWWSDVTIVVPWQLSTGSIHDSLFFYCPLVAILFEVLRIDSSFTISSTFQAFQSSE